MSDKKESSEDEKDKNSLEERPALHNVPTSTSYVVDVNLQVSMSESFFDSEGKQHWRPAEIEHERFSAKLENKNVDDCRQEVLEKTKQSVRAWFKDDAKHDK